MGILNTTLTSVNKSIASHSWLCLFLLVVCEQHQPLATDPGALRYFLRVCRDYISMWHPTSGRHAGAE